MRRSATSSLASPPAPLLGAARAAAENAYCPHSRFRVGAAVQAADGRIFQGCNVENASFGLTICAERVAIFSAVAAGARGLIQLAVACPDADSKHPATVMPCGACRQVMAEFLPAQAEILVDGVGQFTLAELLPRPFELPVRTIGRTSR